MVHRVTGGSYAFSLSNFSSKLNSVNESQQSIQTLSHWMVFHRNNIDDMVEIWHEDFQKAKVDPKRQLIFLYLANDVMQTCMRKYGSKISDSFSSYLRRDIGDLLRTQSGNVVKQVMKVIQVWKDRKVLKSEILDELFSIVPGAVESSSAPSTPQFLRVNPNDTFSPQPLVHHVVQDANDENQDDHEEDDLLLDNIEVVESPETTKISIEIQNLVNSVVNTNLLSASCLKLHGTLQKFNRAKAMYLENDENKQRKESVSSISKVVENEENKQSKSKGNSSVLWSEVPLEVFEIDIEASKKATETLREALDAQMSFRDIVVSSLEEMANSVPPSSSLSDTETIQDVTANIAALEDICVTVRKAQKQERKMRREAEARIQQEAEIKRKAEEEAAKLLREMDATSNPPVTNYADDSRTKRGRFEGDFTTNEVKKVYTYDHSLAYDHRNLSPSPRKVYGQPPADSTYYNNNNNNSGYDGSYNNNNNNNNNNSGYDGSYRSNNLHGMQSTMESPGPNRLSVYPPSSDYGAKPAMTYSPLDKRDTRQTPMYHHHPGGRDAIYERPYHENPHNPPVYNDREPPLPPSFGKYSYMPHLPTSQGAYLYPTRPPPNYPHSVPPTNLNNNSSSWQQLGHASQSGARRRRF